MEQYIRFVKGKGLRWGKGNIHTCTCMEAKCLIIVILILHEWCSSLCNMLEKSTFLFQSSLSFDFHFLYCLTMPGLSKDIWCITRHLYSHQQYQQKIEITFCDVNHISSDLS